MKKLNTIQKRGKLNDVYELSGGRAGVAPHNYIVVRAENKPNKIISSVKFQKGARGVEGSEEGVLMTDLLEMARHQLEYFQKGELATRDNDKALQHIEEALFWLNKRVEDRLDREVLGTDEK